MADPQPSHLQLERRRTNLHFSSWRLSSSILQSQGTVPLPAPAAPAQASNTDYVVARHAALLNGLTQQPCGCYAFLEEQEGQGAAQPQLGLYQIDVGEAGKPPQVHRVCGAAQVQQEAPAGGLTGGGLPPSVVEVQSAAPAPDAPTSSISASSLLLVSGGHGDVSLVVRPAATQQQPVTAGTAAATATAPPVFPLRLAPPLQGVRPVHLAAAFQLPQGMGSDVIGVCCILWAARPRSERQPSRCEVYAVQLVAELPPAPALPPALHVRAVQLLKVSDLPPHGVLAHPAAGSVLLALQPSAASVEEEAAAQRAAAAAAAASHGANGMEADGGGGDVSPRTLQAAVARLAAYTSDEPVGALPQQQYADLYREAGADGVGAMGSEPTCCLYTFVLAADTGASAGGAAGQADAVAAGQGQQGEGQPLLRLVHTLSCQPHKLLTCHLEQPAVGAQEPPTPDTHLPHGGGDGGGEQRRQQPAGSGPRLLLGLTDDVDCAVVAVSCLGGDGDGGGGGEGEAGGFAVEHVSSVPAMAYVAAGKVQRKFLLLVPPGGDVACALVEASQYAYLYRSVAPRQEYGEHQVVDMELPDSGRRGLLGAVLAGSRAGACRLLLLARAGLRVVDM